MAVTLEDIAVELGRATPDTGSIEARQWQRWIDRAVTLINARADRLGVDPATLDPAVVDAVVTLAVVAHARRPDNSTQVDVAIDDGRVSKRYETSQGRVTILDEWWVDLGLVGESAVGSFRMYGEPDCGPYDPWVPLP